MRPPLVLLLLVGWFSISPQTAIAQHAGDTCATAGIIVANGSNFFDTTGASGDDPCAPAIPTVWYRFEAAQNGRVLADLCGSSFNTYLTVFSGGACPASCENIVAQNDSTCGLQSAVEFNVVAGMNYYFAVSGASSGAFGPGIFNFQFAPAAGDTCGEAGNFLGSGSSNFDLSTASAGDDPCDGPDWRTLWYRFTAPSPGKVRVNTCGSSFSTNVQAFIAPACPVACNTRVTAGINPCADGGLEFPILAGQTAYFVVGGANLGDAGPGVFNLQYFPTLPGDACAVAGEIVGNGSYNFDTTFASAGDDPCDGPIWRTLWYRHTATETGIVTADTCGSSVGINLQALIADDCPVSCDDRVDASLNPCGDNQLEFAIFAGQTVFFVIGEETPGIVGPGVLNFAFAPIVAGDTCDQAPTIGANGRYPYDTTGATSDDPCFVSPNYPIVWYRYVAPTDGQTFLRIDDVTYFAFMTVWGGSACPTSCDNVIDSANPNTRPERWITFPATGGASYYIAVGSAQAFSAGPGTLVVRHIQEGSRDINDDGIVNVADVTELGTMIDAGVPLTNEFADFDNDEDVDLADAQALAVFIAE